MSLCCVRAALTDDQVVVQNGSRRRCMYLHHFTMRGTGAQCRWRSAGLGWRFDLYGRETTCILIQPIGTRMGRCGGLLCRSKPSHAGWKLQQRLAGWIGKFPKREWRRSAGVRVVPSRGSTICSIAGNEAESMEIGHQQTLTMVANDLGMVSLYDVSISRGLLISRFVASMNLPI